MHGRSFQPTAYFPRKICDDPDIHGVKLPGSNESCKISLFADDANGIVITDSSIERIFYWCDLYGKASGAKLNKTKTKGLFLGKWKTRSDHPFGISWAEKIKIIGITFGNNITDDDIWHSIYLKFCKVLKAWKLSRNLSLLEKGMVINLMACSKLWYVGSVYTMSDHYVKLFEKEIFSFIWPYGMEPISRNTLYLHKLFGGLYVVNIRQKLLAFQIQHLQKIIKNYDAKFTSVCSYWIGHSLRHLNPDLARNSIPHSDYIPSFYVSCLKSLKAFVDKNPDVTLGNLKTKEIYWLLFDKDFTPKILEKNPTIDFSCVFRNLTDPFLDKFSRDIMFKLIHNVIPVNFLMFKRHIYKSDKCTFCKTTNVETIQHLFFDCVHVKFLKNIVNTWFVTLTKGFQLNFDHILFRDLPDLCKETRKIVLFIISEFVYIIWMTRNKVKFEHAPFSTSRLIMKFLGRIRMRILADYFRFPLESFSEIWCIQNNMFCSIENDNVKISFM